MRTPFGTASSWLTACPVSRPAPNKQARMGLAQVSLIRSTPHLHAPPSALWNLLRLANPLGRFPSSGLPRFPSNLPACAAGTPSTHKQLWTCPRT
ncbi:hypothetical protein T440DRAFT_469760 [Plenodomus tracheiphilus IPT5]|uniref:Uncharacterized protein n=1 Tax=Plenodomus tracheiphilus IPT5 TaxID=1408161 RepID=A0A6A7B3L7_9PLEO|nr:hypothetical protein T440DRAFT_469760 [Plenodomus tracheiphilus IPT5]